MAVLLLFGFLSLLSFVSGIAVFGKEDVSFGCAVEAPSPRIGGPYSEDTRVVVAKRTLLPLGAVCILDSSHDRVGPQTVTVQSWPQTVIWLGSGTAAVSGLTLVVRPPLARPSIARRRRVGAR